MINTLSFNLKIGVIFAGDQELAPFLPLLENCQVESKAMLKFYKGSFKGLEIIALYCGVCKTNAALATQILIDTFGCNTVINGGTCGGIDKGIKLFDTIVATETAYWDVAQDILTEFHPWMDTIYFSSDSNLVELTKEIVNENQLDNIYFGRIISGESFIENNHRKDIEEKFSPLCVDMETAAIAHVCYVNQVPFLSVRTITDTLDAIGIDEFDKNCDKASEISVGVLQALLLKLDKQRQV
ncbi:5'-methylthioadenosine/S-adenosylhomocysteine nucleosidase [Myroides sp. LJL116]